MSRSTIWLICGLGLAGAPALPAQGEGNVEVLASVLAVEDARNFDAAILQRALLDPDSAVRRTAAIAVGRIRDPRGVPLLVPLLLDPDSTVQESAIFALGLLGDSGAATVLIRRARDGAPLSTPAALELLTALARLGGPDAAAALRGVIEGSEWRGRDDQPYLAQRAALESWRLGPLAPTAALLSMVQDPKEDARFAAVYSLGRLRSKAAAARLLDALADRSAPSVRAAAARALSKSYVDSSGLIATSVADALVRLTTDQDATVRVQALRSLGTFGEARLARRIVPLLEDAVPNVQVEAAQTLAELGGADASTALGRVLTGGKGSFARRRAALLGLARLDSAGFAPQGERWASSADWRERAIAAEGWAHAAPTKLAPLLADRDPRVIAAALQAWGEVVVGPDAALLAASRQLLAHADAAVRAVAADGVARAADRADQAALLRAFRDAATDSFPEPALSALNALAAIARVSGPVVEQEMLSGLPTPESYLLRGWAEANWEALAQRWGAAFPLSTGTTMEDYRDIARLFLIGQAESRYPHVTLQIEQLGTVELELFGPDAPLTVAHFLRLVDRRFFDGQRFHRVVPSFVAQAGDPRGDGFGGSGTVLRGEVSRRRYKAYTLGMADAGPDTGGSQWFITLNPQPHLDGRYTVFGQVTDGVPVLLRITQGDLIRSIHR
ncbi:MAG: HEAT repeat domain-containing protein [Gemmatimonadota bacterium]|nr:HEAT repeat domain-containing protein [Gemmatimonadota bacterium]